MYTVALLSVCARAFLLESVRLRVKTGVHIFKGVFKKRVTFCLLQLYCHITLYERLWKTKYGSWQELLNGYQSKWKRWPPPESNFFLHFEEVVGYWLQPRRGCCVAMWPNDVAEATCRERLDPHSWRFSHFLRSNNNATPLFAYIFCQVTYQWWITYQE